MRAVQIINLNRYSPVLRLAHSLVALQNRLTLQLTLAGFKKNLDPASLMRLGTPYGGWWIPRNTTSLTGPKVLVSAGLGHDTSFDVAMLGNGFTVIGLDPLIECCARAQREFATLGDSEVLNLGISTFTGEQSFFQPKNPSHDSWSTINAQEVTGGEVLAFQVISLADLIYRFPQIRNSIFTYLKMDIEGAELAILKNSFGEVARFNFVGIEIDFLSLIPFLAIKKRVGGIFEARKILKEFEKSDFSLVHTENFNFFWEKRAS